MRVEKYKISETRGHLNALAHIRAETMKNLEEGIDAYFRKYPFGGYQTKIVLIDRSKDYKLAVITRYASCD